jgi:hypothetical protein
MNVDKIAALCLNRFTSSENLLTFSDLPIPNVYNEENVSFSEIKTQHIQRTTYVVFI